MEGQRRTTVRRRALRARRFRADRRGVVSTVGTLLSLLVFFALFGVFLTQYLPLWMLQNESLFEGQAQTSLESLKQSVDDQAIFGYPQTYSVPFTMNSQGIPLFAQPTQGSVVFLSGGCSTGFTTSGTTWKPVSVGSCAFEHLGFWTGAASNVRTSRQAINLTTVSNYVEMQLPNRYFPSANLFFENDAVIAVQSGSQQLLLAAPPFNITHSGPTVGGNTTVAGSFLQLAGYPSSVSTQGTKDVYSSLISNGSYSSFGRFVNTTVAPSAPLLFNVSFSVGTPNLCAWYNFLAGVATVANASGTFPSTPSPPTYPAAGVVLSALGASGSVSKAQVPNLCANPTGTTYTVTLTVYNVNYASAYSGVTQISFSQGGL